MAKIYLLKDDSITPLEEKPVLPEERLQNLLEKHPELIPSSEILASPSFLVIKKEAGVSSGSIDLLLIDQYMIPTILETKVANPEARRKIVAQGLDYAASLTTEISGEDIESWAKDYWGERYGAILQERLGVRELNVRAINQNLEKTRVRLLFVADIIPQELKQLVEFLNKSSRELEAYTLEIRRFPISSGDLITVAVFGPSVREKTQKLMAHRLVDKDSLLRMANEKSQKLADRIDRIISEAQDLSYLLTWGTKSAALRVDLPNAPKLKILEITHDGSLYVDFIDPNLRTPSVTSLYEELDRIIDLKQAFQVPDRKFGMARNKLHALSEEKFKELLSLIRKIGKWEAKP